ncbi:amino acid-binding protein [Amycolatopsis antarctica]|uniref:Amino acid-binding protein n=1 Tax=Amycolatopsis antarctica TaxID=1854586 RepID=A0A263D7K0_9PSEU|nr:ACT domain-containing protein [Amycolatopsis antarctica]OZM74403.1 amino acid-binding protein [Amycolatopsis antarctica]
MRRLTLDVRPEVYAVAGMAAGAVVPPVLTDPNADGLVSITRTATELSIVCPESLVPQGVSVDGRWRLLSVRGPLAFTLTGIIAALSSELAAAGVAIFSISTFDTDHVLVKSDDLARATDALRAAGHVVESG